MTRSSTKKRCEQYQSQKTIFMLGVTNTPFVCIEHTKINIYTIMPKFSAPVLSESECLQHTNTPIVCFAHTDGKVLRYFSLNAASCSAGLLNVKLRAGCVCHRSIAVVLHILDLYAYDFPGWVRHAFDYDISPQDSFSNAAASFHDGIVLRHVGPLLSHFEY